MARYGVNLRVRLESRDALVSSNTNMYPASAVRALWLGKAWGAAKASRGVVREVLADHGPALMNDLRFEPPLRTYNPSGGWWDDITIRAIDKMRVWEGTQKHYGWVGGKGKNASMGSRSHSYREGWQISYLDNITEGMNERALAGIRVENNALDRDGEEFVTNVGGEIVVYDNPYTGTLGLDDSIQAPWHKEQGWPTVANVLTEHFAAMTSSWYDRMKAIIESSGREVKTEPPEWRDVDRRGSSDVEF